MDSSNKQRCEGCEATHPRCDASARHAASDAHLKVLHKHWFFLPCPEGSGSQSFNTVSKGIKGLTQREKQGNGLKGQEAYLKRLMKGLDAKGKGLSHQQHRPLNTQQTAYPNETPWNATNLYPWYKFGPAYGVRANVHSRRHTKTSQKPPAFDIFLSMRLAQISYSS